ncbi:MAG: putative porin [Proteobacteria bacterium]|uniref:putative porin n=1 Tax=Aquabacterium sp. TaxID=1872578 RepID=UPI0035C67125|nr:putative porin [Pseudomonadota bacterium]
MNNRPTFRPTAVGALLMGLALALPAHAGERESLESLRETTRALIDALVEQGVLSRDKADALVRSAEQKAQAAAAANPAPKPSVTPDGKPILRVPYVPDSVRAQIRDEVKEEVVAQARAERWGVPNAPAWVNSIKIDGDLRLRYQHDSQSGNNTPAQTYMLAEAQDANGISRAPDFAAFAVNDGGDLLPTADTQSARTRERLRLRLGLTAKVTDEVGVGVRLATGNATDRVSTNQTMGQNFNKYQLFVDRAFVRLDPAEWVSIQGGRIPNPWFSTEMTWSENINFEGFAASFRRPVVDDGFAPFLTVGYFPLREASQPSKNSRSLWGAQLGTALELDSRTRVKLGLAYYQYNNIEGRSETDYEQFVNPSNGNTGISAGLRYGRSEYPVGLRQRGNTVFETNPLLFGSLSDLIKPTWGLAYRFKPLVLTASAEFTHFSPFNIMVAAEYANNTAFSLSDFRRRADATFYSNVNPGGRRDGYQLKFAVGALDVRDADDWQVQLAYRHVGSDAVLDAFTDSDLGLGGTNIRGYTVGLNYGLYRNTLLGMRYMAAENIDPTLNSNFPTSSFKVNTLMVDLNVRF